MTDQAVTEPLALTAAQSAIWLAQRIAPDVPFVIAQYAELDGPLNIDVLVAAYRRAYRELHVGCRLVDIEGTPHTVRDLAADAPVTVVDLRDAGSPVDAALEWMRRDHRRRLDMYDEHLVVSYLLRTGDDHCFWYSRAHHIALDGYGALRLIERTAQVYASRTAGSTPTPFTAASPSRMLEEDRAYRSSPRWDRDRSFWRAQANGLPSGVGLSLALAPGSASTTSHTVSGSISADELTGGGLRSAARIIAAFATFVAVCTETDDVLLTLPVTARTSALLRASAGSVSNVLPLRIRDVTSGTVAEIVTRTEAALTSVLRHQRYRREDIGRQYATGSTDPAQFGPVVNLMMFEQRIDLGEVTGRIQVLTIGPIPDLAVNVYPGATGTKPRLDFEGNSAAYTRAKLGTHHRRFMRFLEEFAAAEQSTPVTDLEPFDSDERRSHARLHGEPSRPPTTLDRLLTGMVARLPNAIALSDHSGQLTYEDLDRASDRLAGALVNRGLGPEDVVAVAISRSRLSVIAFWAAAKAGVAYLPVDPRHPKDRISYILDDSGAACGLTVSDELGTLPRSREWLAIDGPGFGYRVGEEPVVDTEQVVPLDHRNPAYIIYTSGSTGRPKGVAVTHSGLADLAAVITDKYGITPNSRVLHLASPTFDTAVVEVLSAAMAGATLVVAPTMSFGGEALTRLLRDERITHLLATPSALATVAPEDLNELTLVIVGGEPCSPALVDRWTEGRAMRNAYGPTETTCSVTITDPLDPDRAVSIGGLMRGVAATVRDSRLRPVPPGVYGELYISGPSLARGYHRRPGLTATKFVADPGGKPGARTFRSGDHVRWDDEDDLEFRGRSDGQVKLRGLRIELGEIDAALGRFPDVTFAVTVVHRSHFADSILASYVVPSNDSTIDLDALRSTLRECLPEYMVPAVITVIDTIPLTPTGKLDRSALPEPRFGRREHRSAETPTEKLVAEAFSEVLTTRDLDVEQSFFDLGGDSLSATGVVARINERWGADLGVRELFDAPTVAGLAARLPATASAENATKLGALPLPEMVPLAPSQQFIDRETIEPALYNIAFTVRVQGVLDPGAFTAALGDVVRRHPTLRTIYPDSPSGPHQQALPVDDVTSRLEIAPLDSETIDRVLHTGFDVRVEPPLRIALFENDPTDHTVACAVHHIAVDGWSMSVIARDLIAAYSSRARGIPPHWPQSTVSFADYTMWRIATLGDDADPSSTAASQIAYWRRRLNGPPAAALPTDRPRTREWTYEGRRVDFTLDGARHRAVIDAARSSRTGVFSVLHAAVAVLVSRLTRSSDVTVGVPVSGRGRPELDEMVGMFVNTVVLRSAVDPQMSFIDVVDAARDTELAGFARSDVPFERLVELLHPPRTPSLHPFFQVAMSLENFAPARLDLDGLAFDVTPAQPPIAKCDVHFYFTEQFDNTGAPAGIEGHALYATDLFDESTVKVMVKTLGTILDAA